MNESILAAIKKKAEEKYPEPKDFNEMVKALNQMTRYSNIKNYTSGYQDAIVEMLKFVEWAILNCESFSCDEKEPFTFELERKEYTTIELLTKYMEEQNNG